MKGRILDYSVQDNLGIISGTDGNRYRFAGSEWRSTGVPSDGETVDFKADGPDAIAVYPDSVSTVPAEYKSKVAAGLLAIFLGGLGIHKFYLGYTAQGLILLALSIVASLLVLVLIGFFLLFAIGVICLIEGIIYLTKPDEEFHQTYVVGKKPWF